MEQQRLNVVDSEWRKWTLDNIDYQVRILQLQWLSIQLAPTLNSTSLNLISFLLSTQSNLSTAASQAAAAEKKHHRVESFKAQVGDLIGS